MNDHENSPLPSPDPANESPGVTMKSAAPDPIELDAARLVRGMSLALRRCLACNPFYLVSAALLLYSFYLVSADTVFLRTEVSQLSFNLGSLQIYEALVVATAIFLARHAVWYDSTLLVGLENLLVLVPFILVSQAALIDPRLVWILCLAAGLLATARFGLLKRLIRPLNLPPRLLGIGMVLLVANMALPVVYRLLHQSKLGTKPDWGAAYQTNQYVWWLMLPALCGLVNVVPANRPGGELWPQRRWLPLGLVALWLTGTITHLYCLGYVYDFTLRPDLVAPAVWMLAWALCFRAAQLAHGARAAWKNALWLLPMSVTLLATGQPGKQVFPALTLLNVAFFSLIYLRRRQIFTLHSLLISVVALVGGLPENWGRSLTPEFTHETFIAGAAVVYVLAWIAFSRNPKLGLLGALVGAIGAAALVPGSDATHWAIQTGLAFFLLHSLRWDESVDQTARAVRWLAAAAWLGHALLWTYAGDAGWATCAIAAPVLAGFLAARWLHGRWGPAVIGLGAVLVALCPPAQYATSHLSSAPPGLLAVAGSFLLFGVGTLAAIGKHKWATPK